MGKSIVVVDKNVDLKLLVEKIEHFLKDSNKSNFDYSTFKTQSLSDERGFSILIEYGMKSPTAKIAVIIEGKPNNFEVHENVSKANILAVGISAYLRPFGLADGANALIFYEKLWKFVEQTVSSLTNSDKSYFPL